MNVGKLVREMIIAMDALEKHDKAQEERLHEQSVRIAELEMQNEQLRRIPECREASELHHNVDEMKKTVDRIRERASMHYTVKGLDEESDK